MFHRVSFIYFLSFSFPFKLLKMGLGFDLEAHLLKKTLFLLLCHWHFIFLIYNIYDYIYMCTYIYISICIMPV